LDTERNFESALSGHFKKTLFLAKGGSLPAF